MSGIELETWSNSIFGGKEGMKFGSMTCRAWMLNGGGTSIC